jgi:hypothetical protein
MDIGDFIFLFIFIIVIIGRLLSWFFKQFVENVPDNQSDKTSSKPQSMKDYIVDWIRSLEERIEDNQWNNHLTQTAENEWEQLEAHKYDKELVLPANNPEKAQHTNIQTEKIKIATTPKKRIHQKTPFHRIDAEKAMMYHEIFSPPISLRQESHYGRQFC